jgi:hypothetical protein
MSAGLLRVMTSMMFSGIGHRASGIGHRALAGRIDGAGDD